MGGSVFGSHFRISTFGESHGGAVGVVIDGVPPGLELTEEEIQVQLDRRRGGQSLASTPRAEPDLVHFMSGMFEGKTTGTPILMILYNEDARPQAYDAIKNLYRPGHADHTYLAKYGIRDHRGSGRASGRETAARVAAGAVARKLLEKRGIRLFAYSKRIAGIECPEIDPKTFDPKNIEQNPLRASDGNTAERMMVEIEKAKSDKDSVGGIVECRISGVPAGLGEPVFDKLDALLAHAMLSIGAVKGIEFGTGFAAADLRGSEHNDGMDAQGFLSNHAGGIIGGISNGQEIVFRLIVKPTSSIEKPQQTVGVDKKSHTIVTEGRHDVCILPRIVPVVEAMTCLVLEDQFKALAALRE
ncbi:MAG: chorismate synthase [Treponemataceae bacterium]